MSFTFDEMEEAVSAARITISQFEIKISAIANLIAGNLRSGKVGYWTLDELKKELKNYDMRTGCWKD